MILSHKNCNNHENTIFFRQKLFWTPFFSHLSLKEYSQCHPLRILGGSWAQTSYFKITTLWHATTTSWNIRGQGNPMMKVFFDLTGIYRSGGGRVWRLLCSSYWCPSYWPPDFGIFDLSFPQITSPNTVAIPCEAVWRASQSICEQPNTKTHSRKSSSPEA